MQLIASEDRSIVPTLEKVDRTTSASYFERLQNDQLCGEKKAILAVLQDAIETIVKAKNNIHYWEAVDWVECGEESNWPFTFINCCDALNLSPSLIRKKLKEAIDGKKENKKARRRRRYSRGVQRP